MPVIFAQLHLQASDRAQQRINLIMVVQYERASEELAGLFETSHILTCNFCNPSQLTKKYTIGEEIL